MWCCFPTCLCYCVCLGATHTHQWESSSKPCVLFCFLSFHVFQGKVLLHSPGLVSNVGGFYCSIPNTENTDRILRIHHPTPVGIMNGTNDPSKARRDVGASEVACLGVLLVIFLQSQEKRVSRSSDGKRRVLVTAGKSCSAPTPRSVLCYEKGSFIPWCSLALGTSSSVIWIH